MNLSLKAKNAIDAVFEFMRKHGGICAFVHIWITACLILTGENFLEPLAFTWFWSPLLTRITIPDGYDVHTFFGNRFGSFYWNKQRYFFAAGWLLNVTLLPWLLWTYLCRFDHVLHMLRDRIGKAIGLGGQTGLVLTVATIVSLPFLIAEYLNRKPARRSL
ncbi:MAG: hypothetical protein K2W82_17760 [Candidatus Obscuribacterales bacterium]|nr:hypothetical protein [Candidatus Obscuribacterales bacterium]